VSFVYLGLLLGSLAGLALLDWRFKLAFAVNGLASFWAILIPSAYLLIWDAVGIWLGIFFIGETDLLTGVLLAPNMPLEEPFFLLLLCYTTLIVFRAIDKRRGK
jgi:lycopene cyclase domain-containing protein